MIRVVIADDHQIVLDGIQSILSSDTSIELVGEVLSGRQLLAIVSSKPVDVVLFDLNMPDTDGFEAARQIKEQYPKVKLIALTMLDDQASIKRILKIGVEGYLLKNTGKAEMITAIKAVVAGETYFSKQVAQTVLSSFQEEKQSPTIQLTPRELEVLQLIAKEYTSAQIAEALFIGINTVETHRKNLHSKLGVKSVVGLLKYAIEHGLIED